MSGLIVDLERQHREVARGSLEDANAIRRAETDYERQCQEYAVALAQFQCGLEEHEERLNSWRSQWAQMRKACIDAARARCIEVFRRHIDVRQIRRRVSRVVDTTVTPLGRPEWVKSDFRLGPFVLCLSIACGLMLYGAPELWWFVVSLVGLCAVVGIGNLACGWCVRWARRRLQTSYRIDGHAVLSIRDVQKCVNEVEVAVDDAAALTVQQNHDAPLSHRERILEEAREVATETRRAINEMATMDRARTLTASNRSRHDRSELSTLLAEEHAARLATVAAWPIERLKMPRCELEPPRVPMEPVPPASTDHLHTWKEHGWEVAYELHREMLDAAGHVLLGYDPNTGEPVSVPWSWLDEHTYAVGATGSGKTSAALMPLCLQIVRSHPGPRTALIVSDPKPDPPMLWSLAVEARLRGRRFYFVNFDAELQSDSLDVWAAFEHLRSRPGELADAVAEGCDLVHGTGHETSYHSIVNTLELERAVRRAPRLSFAELARSIKSKNGPHALEAAAKIEKLAGLSTLHRLEPKPGARGRTVSLDQVMENGDVLYIHAASETARDAARLILHACYLTARRRASAGHLKRCFVVCDEFQRQLSRNIGELLNVSRSAGLSFILANQSEDALRTTGANVLTQVVDNVGVRMDFTITPSTLAELQAMSGEKHVADIHAVSSTKGKGRSVGITKARTRSHQATWTAISGRGEGVSPRVDAVTGELVEQHTFHRSWSNGVGGSTGESVQDSTQTSETEHEEEGATLSERVTSRLEPNEILQASSTKLCFVLRTRTGGAPRIVQGKWAITPEEFEARLRARWPLMSESAAETTVLPDHQGNVSDRHDDDQVPAGGQRSRERGLLLDEFVSEHDVVRQFEAMP